MASALALVLFISGCSTKSEKKFSVGTTEITKWHAGKNAAISITYDDATINQFRQAMPAMDSLGLKGTFFINTADIPGSTYAPKFIGRTIGDIIRESAHIPTDTSNFFERANAVRFLDISNAVETHNHIGAIYEDGDEHGAFRETDDALALARRKNS